MRYGVKLAVEDYYKYKNGKMTKEELMAACDFARLSAAWGDYEAQEIGSDYLYKMQELGFIKNLRRID